MTKPRFSRFHRDPALLPLVVQDRDLAVLYDLFLFRFASTSALLRTAAWAGGGGGRQYVPKRLTALWKAGYMERFVSHHSVYLRGSQPFVYTIGTGKASAAARTGRRPSDISPEGWRRVLSEAAPARDRARHALGLLGIAAEEGERVLHNNSELALRHYTGDSSGVRHRLLAAEFLSRFWYDARMGGAVIEDIRPDGIADLSVHEPDPRQFRDILGSTGVVPIRPDCIFTIAGVRYALEAETGTSSAEKLFLKLRRYARRVSFDPHLRLLVVYASASHAARARDMLQRLPALSRAAEVHVADAP